MFPLNAAAPLNISLIVVTEETSQAEISPPKSTDLYASSSIRSSSNQQATGLTMTDRINLTEAETGEADVQTSGGGKGGDEAEGVTYNWSLFHLMFALSTLYIMMTLTNWYSPGDNVSIESISANMGAVWVKIISAWLCAGIYVWTLVAPIILPDRDFSV